MLKFFVSTASGSSEWIRRLWRTIFNVDVLGDPVSLIVYMGIVVAIGVAVCLIGVQNGLEKVTKIMMLAPRNYGGACDKQLYNARRSGRTFVPYLLCPISVL